MKLYLIFIILLVSAGVFAQETDKKPKSPDLSKVELRTNSRQQAVVKRDNSHQRKDARAVQMNRSMRISKQKRNMQNKSMQMKNRKNMQTKQQKQRMQKQKHRAIKNKAKR